MQKAVLFLFPLLVGVTSNLFSQKNDSIPGSLIKKNEIGVNIAPVLVTMLGGEHSYPEFSLLYKRSLIDLAYRIGLSYKSDYLPYDQYTHFGYSAISSNDSIVISQYALHDITTYRLNLGVERIRGDYKFQRFYGVDLMFFYLDNYYSTYIDSLEKDTTSYYS
ncbi:MAG: hypothetical protein ABII90_14625 [Bacteroidota bacterium]